MLCCIADGLWKVILLQFLDIDDWANLLTKVTVDTGILVDNRIPETFDVCLVGDTALGAYVATGIAATAVFASFYFYHN